MKNKIVLLVLILSMTSCGYSLKSKHEVVRDENYLADYREQLDEVMNEMEKVKDSVHLVLLNNQNEMTRYKDSIEFTNLSKTMCYDKTPHRHSCEIYK